MPKLTDPEFKYTPSYQTNIRELFDRVRAEQEATKAREAAGIPQVMELKRRERK
jgi:hypothetical protein